MAKIVIIGAGGVGGAAAHKCAMNGGLFQEIWLASRTLARCEAVKADILRRHGVSINTAQVDADDSAQVVALLRRLSPDLLLNLALPYQDLSLMEACLECGVPYIDTANYEPRDTPLFEYRWQWDYQKRFADRGLMALLGAGFDPGVTNAFCAYGKRRLFDELRTIDILDCNAGEHGHVFATNFNPEINIREVTQPVRHWRDGQWVVTPSILEQGAVHFAFDYPVVGAKDSYLLYHEEMESLVAHFSGLQRVRFWMTFSERYLTTLRVLRDVGMTAITPIVYEGRPIVPLQFLKALLPDPASLAARYTGKTVIGCVLGGLKDGRMTSQYIYNVCDHEACWREVGAQAISYTTAVPAVTAAIMLLKGLWSGSGVYNVEQLDPVPFLEELAHQGLPWHVTDFTGRLPP